jgi:putative flavoprotein involved in K+ transport
VAFAAAGITIRPCSLPCGTAAIEPDIVIIGGGPAGLSLGYELSTRGAAYRIVEQGARPGHAWARMQENLKLLSPWKVDRLRGTRDKIAPRHALVSRAVYTAYLERYAERHRLALAAGTQVKSVRRQAGGGFVLDTSRGELRARRLVNATGYFFNPHVPRLPGAAESAIPQLHTGAYFNPGTLRALPGAVKRVLILGKGISSGQVATELHDAGFEVCISHRAPIGFAPDPWVLAIAFHFYFVYENLRVRIDPYYRRDSFPPMEGGYTRELIESGRIGRRPDVVRLHGANVEFVDGRREPFDALIYATGYRPALAHLAGLVGVDPASGLPNTRGGFESTEAPGLYFLGLDMQRSFRSRYLRGIREDAAALAGLLTGR